MEVPWKKGDIKHTKRKLLILHSVKKKKDGEGEAGKTVEPGDKYCVDKEARKSRDEWWTDKINQDVKILTLANHLSDVLDGIVLSK